MVPDLLREASPRRVKAPLWQLSRTMAHRKVVASCGRPESNGAQGCPKGVAPRLRDGGYTGPRQTRHDGVLQDGRRHQGRVPGEDAGFGQVSTRPVDTWH